MQYRAIPRNDDDLRLAMIRLAKNYGRYGYRKDLELKRIEGCKQSIEWFQIVITLLFCLTCMLQPWA